MCFVRTCSGPDCDFVSCVITLLSVQGGTGSLTVDETVEGYVGCREGRLDEGEEVDGVVVGKMVGVVSRAESDSGPH